MIALFLSAWHHADKSDKWWKTKIVPMVCNVYLTQIIRGCGEEENQLKNLKTNNKSDKFSYFVFLPKCRK